MAVTVTINFSSFDYNRYSDAPEHWAKGTIAFDDSYPTGGEAVDFTSASVMQGNGGAFTTVHGVQATVRGIGYVCLYDHTNGKFMLFQSDDAVDPLDQVADMADLSMAGEGSGALTADFVVYGV